MNESFETLLNAARQLPPVQQRLLAQKLLEDTELPAAPLTKAQIAALEAVEKTRGTIKGLDRETLIWLAEDEELCGY
jgi:cell division protein FtsN